jgi:hypothetical protein
MRHPPSAPASSLRLGNSQESTVPRAPAARRRRLDAVKEVVTSHPAVPSEGTLAKGSMRWTHSGGRVDALRQEEAEGGARSGRRFAEAPDPSERPVPGLTEATVTLRPHNWTVHGPDDLIGRFVGTLEAPALQEPGPRVTAGWPPSNVSSVRSWWPQSVRIQDIGDTSVCSSNSRAASSSPMAQSARLNGWARARPIRAIRFLSLRCRRPEASPAPRGPHQAGPPR